MPRGRRATRVGGNTGRARPAVATKGVDVSTRTSPGMPARGRRPGRGMAAAGLPRPRLGLRDASIRAKLGLILVIPLLAIASLTIIRLVDSGQRALSAKLAAALRALGGDVAGATHQFPREPILAAQALDGPTVRAGC